MPGVLVYYSPDEGWMPGVIVSAVSLATMNARYNCVSRLTRHNHFSCSMFLTYGVHPPSHTWQALNSHRLDKDCRYCFTVSQSISGLFWDSFVSLRLVDQRNLFSQPGPSSLLFSGFQSDRHARVWFLGPFSISFLPVSPKTRAGALAVWAVSNHGMCSVFANAQYRTTKYCEHGQYSHKRTPIRLWSTRSKHMSAARNNYIRRLPVVWAVSNVQILPVLAVHPACQGPRVLYSSPHCWKQLCLNWSEYPFSDSRSHMVDCGNNNY